ncbi:uncharacterized protein Z520_01316 [Fonsecaea multimorphosa CBS 102226]|uniref:C2H2-type domain-containing protein n=1 Tax=Fonsecaea multimorphosa CBS 102226 TaxID=1442371 RepID=A0A0D2HLT6_9EURO|nr:uncharacterized protein Z520_01316 [Fonsecaea multimorphosa CBS 102226]KIY02851.1 hypothetical protein Z520_01316 [Fonsecaea multimorphosa CBS 102226]OAL31015.1 hypothetical protein AYO22_01310 [Fonsecaea multimorphosa]
MGSYDHGDFLRDHFGPAAFFAQQPLSMSVPEASSGLSISLPTSISCQLGSPTYSHSFCTPRTIAPHPGYMPAPPTHGYHSEEAYAITSHSASARGRSWSGASTVSADYSVASQQATPRSSYSCIDPCNQYRVLDDNHTHHTGGPALHSRGQSPLLQEDKELAPKQEGDGIISPSSKAVADNRTFCTHQDCLGEDGSPKKFFSRKADVTRHYKSRHDIKYIDCPKKNCERKGSQGFTRRDHLTEHLRGFHMEKIAKRQIANTKVKRGEKHASEDSSSSNSSSEAVTPPEHGDEIFDFSCGKHIFEEHIDQAIKQESRQSSDEEGDNISPLYEDCLPKRTNRKRSFAKHVDQSVKQESPQSSDGDGDDSFPGHEDCLPKRTKQFKNATQKRKIKIRQSNILSQHSRTGGAAQPNPHGMSFQPEFATSRMMPDSPVYTTHHQHQHQVYTTSGMMASLYTANSSMDSFYGPSSMIQAYENLPTQTMARYRVEPHDDESHFQSLQSNPYRRGTSGTGNYLLTSQPE